MIYPRTSTENVTSDSPQLSPKGRHNTRDAAARVKRGRERQKGGMQHEDFPGGHPSQYYSRPSTLNCGVLMGSGALVLVWSHPFQIIRNCNLQRSSNPPPILTHQPCRPAGQRIVVVGPMTMHGAFELTTQFFFDRKYFSNGNKAKEQKLKKNIQKKRKIAQIHDDARNILATTQFFFRDNLFLEQQARKNIEIEEKWIKIRQASSKLKRVQHEDFPGGHPSQYYSRPSTLNCGVLMGSGALVLV